MHVTSLKLQVAAKLSHFERWSSSPFLSYIRTPRDHLASFSTNLAFRIVTSIFVQNNACHVRHACSSDISYICFYECYCGIVFNFCARLHGHFLSYYTMLHVLPAHATNCSFTTFKMAFRRVMSSLAIIPQQEAATYLTSPSSHL